MEDLLHKKVRAAAIAGWWTLLVAVLMAAGLWGGLLAVSRCRPPWVMAMWGGVSWETMQTVILWAIVVFRLVIGVLFLAVVWLTIWSRRLRKMQS